MSGNVNSPRSIPLIPPISQESPLKPLPLGTPRLQPWPSRPGKRIGALAPRVCLRILAPPSKSDSRSLSSKILPTLPITHTIQATYTKRKMARSLSPHPYNQDSKQNGCRRTSPAAIFHTKSRLKPLSIRTLHTLGGGRGYPQPHPTNTSQSTNPASPS